MISLKHFKSHTEGAVSETELIQAAIDKAASSGEELIIERGVYVTGTLFLKSGLRLKLEEGAYILGSENFEDYSTDVNLFVDAVDHERGRSLIYADGAEDITIYGSGVIDGRGGIFSVSHPHHGERPFLIRIMNSKNISVEGITLKNPAAWTLHLMNCEDVSIKSLTVHSRVNANNDGIDIDSCHRCVIDSCHIDSGDDAVCLKATVDHPCSDITVKNCVITTDWAGFKIGTESVGDFENIVFENSYIYDCNGCAIKICPVDGGSVKELTIRNIALNNATGPVFIANGERMREYQPGSSRDSFSAISSVTIDGLSGSCADAAGTVYKGEPWGNAKSAVCISGTERTHIKNVCLKNFDLSMSGGVAAYEKHDIPPMGTRYPEFHNFGILPAWGIYVRNADNITCSDIKLSPRSADCRPEIYKEND